MLKIDDETVTPNQAAKLIILDAISSKAGYWFEGGIVDSDQFGKPKTTDREDVLISEALQKQFDRVQKFLGFEGYTLG